MDILGKVAIVTGGASGLGEGTVRAYVEKGAKVAIFDMNQERAEAIINDLGADNVAFFNVNVADEEQVTTAINGVVEKFGAIHICNNYAGIGAGIKTLGKDGPHPLDKYKTVIEVNLIGTFNVARLVSEQMAKNEPFNENGGRGVIINTASVAAYEGQVGQVAYSATKGGVVGMTLPMARDLANFGIRVNTIVPGLIHTPLFDTLPENVYQALESSVVNPQRLGRPEEIAHLSVFLAENEYMNGECVRLDGAIRMQPR
ncbi:3-hydroxyacyl-CoA dehydrogenase [Gammaproteobacteria bacterium 45_16_T64]|nr:3-hydroxyacyl-CoA dehydrogenase [Gammaproteobacteria bacterium 45_16_T64]